VLFNQTEAIIPPFHLSAFYAPNTGIREPFLNGDDRISTAALQTYKVIVAIASSRLSANLHAPPNSGVFLQDSGYVS
jgi:hypothetical protein